MQFLKRNKTPVRMFLNSDKNHTLVKPEVYAANDNKGAGQQSVSKNTTYKLKIRLPQNSRR